jgi:AraC-like DNA-binding protein
MLTHADKNSPKWASLRFSSIFTFPTHTRVIAAVQCRMARAALNWTLEELAASTGMSRRTLARFESTEHIPRAIYLRALQQEFEKAGVTFLPNKGVAPPPDAL